MKVLKFLILRQKSLDSIALWSARSVSYCTSIVYFVEVRSILLMWEKQNKNGRLNGIALQSRGDFFNGGP